MAPNAGNFWECLDGFGLFLYIHSIIFVVNYKMNIISSHKMFIISPSVTRAAVRGWFWVLGCSSDMSGCIHWDWYWYPGDCIRSSATSEAILPWPSVAELRHRPRITDFWGSFCQSSVYSVWRIFGVKIRGMKVQTFLPTVHYLWRIGISRYSWDLSTSIAKI